MDVEEIQTDEFSPDEILRVEEEGVKKIKHVDELDQKIFEAGSEEKSSAQIALKLALQLLGKGTVVVTGSQRVVDMISDVEVIRVEKPISAAKRLAKKEEKVLCFSDEGTIDLENLEGNFLCIAFGKNKLWKHAQASKATYVATASIGYIEDYLKKVKRASQKKGLRFINIFAPATDDFRNLEFSDLLSVARMASDTGALPLFEIKKNEFTQTHRPENLPVSRYYEMINQDEKELDEKIDKNILLMEKEKYWLLKDVDF